MKRLFPYIISLISAISIALIMISCEKDDICVEGTPTTPRLIIRFYDNVNTTEFKTADNLLVQSTDETIEFVNTSTDSIAIPLRILENNTTFQFIRDSFIDDAGTPDDTSDDTNTGNLDVFTINYENNQLFVSRACGFKNVFNNAAATVTTDTDNWISSFNIVNNAIENENNAQIHIFH